MRQTSGTAPTAASTVMGKNPSARKIRKVWPAPTACALSRARARGRFRYYRTSAPGACPRPRKKRVRSACPAPSQRIMGTSSIPSRHRHARRRHRDDHGDTRPSPRFAMRARLPERALRLPAANLTRPPTRRAVGTAKLRPRPSVSGLRLLHALAFQRRDDEDAIGPSCSRSRCSRLSDYSRSRADFSYRDRSRSA